MSLNALSDNEMKHFITRSYFAWDVRKQHRINSDALKKLSIHPSYKLRVQNIIILFSSPIQLSYNRIGIIGFCPNDGDYFLHSYYLSSSHVVWRYLPSYKLNNKNQVIQYGKGYGEDSVNLPIYINQELFHILKKKKPLPQSELRDIFFLKNFN